jgi:hypothetical protein
MPMGEEVAGAGARPAGGQAYDPDAAPAKGNQKKSGDALKTRAGSGGTTSSKQSGSNSVSPGASQKDQWAQPVKGPGKLAELKDLYFSQASKDLFGSAGWKALEGSDQIALVWYLGHEPGIDKAALADTLQKDDPARTALLDTARRKWAEEKRQQGIDENLARLPVRERDPQLPGVSRPTPRPFDNIKSWLYSDDHLAPNHIAAALQDKTALGKLSEDKKRELVDLALPNYATLAFDKVDGLVELVENDNGVRRLVAERLLHRALHPGGDSQCPETEARAFALSFMRAMRADTRGMAEMISGLSRQEGFRLTLILGSEKLRPMPTVSGVPRDDPRRNDARLLSDARSQILFGLNGLAKTPANSATITAIIYGHSDALLTIFL